MKTRTATSDISGSTLQAGLVATPARLVRTGVMALALTAAGMGFFGAGSAFADGPRTTGQLTTTQVTQSTQIKKIQPAGSSLLGKVNTTTVTAVKVSSSGNDKNGRSCSEQAEMAEDLLIDSDRYAEEGNYETSFDQAKMANNVINRAVSNGCVVIVE